MKRFSNYLFIVVLALTSVSCSVDDEANRNAVQNPVEEMNTLDGTYVLTTMDATPAADLDNDGTASVNLLVETTCFDIMEATFNSNGSFTATNSKLDFNGGPNNNELTCTSRTDSGTYTLDGSILTLTVEVGGQTFTDTAEINLTETNFSFTVTEAEVDEYVEDDGTSSASEINELFLVYTKQ